MKPFSPTVLFFILLLFSCNENKIGPNKNEKSPNTETFKNSKRATEKDSLLYVTLYNKIQTAILSQKEDSLTIYLQKLKSAATTSSYKAGYYYLKGAYFHAKQADSSFANYEKSRKLYVSEKHFERAGYSLMMMSELQRTAADYVGAETSMTEALHYLKESKQYHNHIYNVFGLIYKGLYDYENALFYYKKALESTDSKNIQAKNIIFNNIALIYMDKKEYPTAIHLLDSLNKQPNLNADSVMKAKVLSNLGNSIFLSKNGNGLSYLKEAEIIQDTINDFYGKLSNYLNLSNAYLVLNKSKSKSYAMKSLVLAKQLHNGDDRLRALELLSKATANKKESEKLLEDYISLNDSIKKSRQIAKNQFSKIKYDSSEKEKEALQFKAESAESKLIANKITQRNEMLFIAVILLVAVIFFSYAFMKKKNTIDKVKESYATETRISKKVHDEVANDIYNMMMFSGTQDLSSSENKEKLLSDLDNVYKRSRDISRENATIETGENFASQLLAMLSEYQNEQVNVIASGIKEIGWSKIDTIKKIAIYRVLQEILVNMAKHSQATLCVLTFKKLEKNIAIYYSDNGIGMDAKKIILKNGLENAENRINGISGTLTFDSSSEKGLKITIIFKA